MTRACLRLCALLICSVAPLPAALDASPGPIAEVLCDHRDRMRQKLRQSFQSERAWQGLREPDQIIELWQDAHGDWTLVIAHANGSTCIVAMGTALSPFHAQPHG